MNQAIKSFLQGVLIGSITLSGFVTSQNVPVNATGLGNCTDGSAHKDESSPFSYDAPNGQIITSVWVKAGSQNQENACHELTSSKPTNGCYTAIGLGTSSVSVSRTGEESPSCKNISHVEFITTPISPSISPSASPRVSPSPCASPSVSPSPSPIASPSESPVESPSATPSESPVESPSASPSESPAASPSVSPSASPSTSPAASPSETPAVSPSPSSSSSSENNNSNNNSSNNSSSPNNSGSVAGTSTEHGEVLGEFAGTGVVEDVMMNALGSVGGLMTFAGAVLYGKKKRS